MTAPSKRTEIICPEQVERLRKIKGWSLEKLATKARINIRTLRRNLAGKPAYWSTIGRLAEALGVTPEKLQLGYDDEAQKAPQIAAMPFSLDLQLTGETHTPQQIALIANLTAEVLARLASAGITVRASETTLAVLDPRDQSARVIYVVYGMLKTGDPFWCCVAVKPSKRHLFLQLQADDKLDLYKFDDFGEIIVSGDGKGPDEEIARQVAVLYGVDFNDWKRPVNIDAAIDDAVRNNQSHLHK